MRDYDFCVYCGRLTVGRDSEGERACIAGEGCTIRLAWWERWTPGQDSEFVRMYKAGKRIVEIAAQFQMSTHAVRRKIVSDKLAGARKNGRR